MKGNKAANLEHQAEHWFKYCRSTAKELVVFCSEAGYAGYTEELKLFLSPHSFYKFWKVWVSAKIFLGLGDLHGRAKVEEIEDFRLKLISLLGMIDQGMAIDKKQHKGRDFLLSDCQYLQLYEKANETRPDFFEGYFLLSLVELLRFREGFHSLMYSSNAIKGSRLIAYHLISYEQAASIQVMETLLGAVEASLHAFSQVNLKVGKWKARAEEFSKRQSEFANCDRPDQLTLAIKRILYLNPEAGATEVKGKLRDSLGNGLIVDWDEDAGIIYYKKNPNLKESQILEAPISGIKDRVKRIKKKNRTKKRALTG